MGSSGKTPHCQSKMKVLAVIFALVALTSGFKMVTKTAQMIPQAKSRQCGPDETTCPSGCCPEGPNWYCCPDAFWPGCAATADDCPYEAKQAKLLKLAKSRQCGPDETTCPAGCCPEANWFCCDNNWCAKVPEDCPFDAKRSQLKKLAKTKQCGPDETSCPGGCCPVANWFCCPDDWCAATADDCPYEAKKAKLMEMAKNN